MYTDINFRTKAELKAAVARGTEVSTYQPGGMFPPTMDGTVHLEGPHFPEAHSWYVTAVVKDGYIVQGSLE